MAQVSALLVAFLAIGLLARKFNGWTRLLLIVLIVAVLVYANRG